MRHLHWTTLYRLVREEALYRLWRQQTYLRASWDDEYRRGIFWTRHWRQLACHGKLLAAAIAALREEGEEG